jgi:V8-like Glu-specific endopeptidase
MMATGWLIRPDLLVTAGHCAYDWGDLPDRKPLGRAVAVEAYIGYNGKTSIGTENVQFRRGTQIVTTEGWVKSSHNRRNDVSFIKLNKPFTGVTPFKYTATPGKNNDVIGVVGYPGDKSVDKEEAAQMYEDWKRTIWDLSKSADHVLEYRINTYEGTFLPLRPLFTHIAVPV